MISIHTGVILFSVLSFEGYTERAGIPRRAVPDWGCAFWDGHLRHSRPEPRWFQRCCSWCTTGGQTKRRHLHLQRREEDIKQAVLTGMERNMLRSFRVGQTVKVRLRWSCACKYVMRPILFVFSRESLAPNWILSCSISEGPSTATKTWMVTHSRTSRSVPMAKWCSSGGFNQHNMRKIETVIYVTIH